MARSAGGDVPAAARRAFPKAGESAAGPGRFGITLDVDQAAEVWLAARGYDPDYGARPLRWVIQRELSDRLAVLLLDGTFQAGETVHIGVAEDRLKFR
jgi:ATP-dependent Clp protease ATP-binding subunit ClpA